MSKRIIIIGSINHDIVKFPDRRVIRGWGGIMFNVIAAARHYPHNWTIAPVAWLGHGARLPVRKLLRQYDSVDGTGLFACEHPHNTCRLTYNGAGERTERLLPMLPPLNYSHIRKYLYGDAVLLNPISGFDFRADTVERIRESFGGIIYFDIHSLMLGRRKSGDRYRRRHPHAHRYVSVADYVQLNEWEFEVFFGSAYRQSTAAESLNVLPASVRTVFVTRGPAGCDVWLRHSPDWNCKSIRPPKAFTGGNPTGCGDVFGAVCLGRLVAGNLPVHAARVGVQAATAVLASSVDGDGP